MRHNAPINDPVELVVISVCHFPDPLIVPRVLLLRALKQGVARQGIEILEWSHFVAGNYSIHCFCARDRGAALKAAMLTTQELGLADFAEIGFGDRAEGYLRTVYPTNGTSHLNDLITPENISIGIRKAAAIEAHYRSLRDAAADDKEAGS